MCFTRLHSLLGQVQGDRLVLGNEWQHFDRMMDAYAGLACWAFLCGLISDRVHCLIYLKFIFINFYFLLKDTCLKEICYINLYHNICF